MSNSKSKRKNLSTSSSSTEKGTLNSTPSLSSSPSIFPPLLNVEEISVIEHPDPNNLVVEIKGISESMINSIRQAVKSQVQTVAFNWVFIKQNKGVMTREQLALHVGGVDLKMNPHLMKPLPESFSVKYLEESTKLNSLPNITQFEDNILVYEINVQCFWDEETKQIINQNINASHLIWKPFGNQQEKFGPHLSIVDPNYPITRLYPGQVLELEAWAIIGKPEKHAKFSAVSDCTFNLKNQVKLIKDSSLLDMENLAEMLINVCPQKVFGRKTTGSRTEEEEDNNKKTKVNSVEVLNENACDLCNECIMKPSLSKYVQVQPKENHYWFYIEGKGRISARTILVDAIHSLKEQTSLLSIQE